MRSGWEDATLAECTVGKASYGANAAAVDFDPALPRYLRITDIDENGYLIAENPKSINHADAKGNYLERGDIVFARSGATVGKTYLHNSEQVLAYAGYLIRFRPDRKRVLPEYLFLFTQSDHYKTWIKNNLRAGAQPNVNAQEYSDLLIPLPPLPEQRKIAAILRTWDEAIEKHNSYLSTIRKKRTLVIQQTLNAKKWPLTTLAEISDIIVSNVDKKSASGQQAVRLCNYMDVFYNRYITGTIPFMEATASDREIATYALKKGDAVFTKDSETPEDIAVCASVEEDIEGLVCGYHLAIARPKSDKILGTYLAEAINSPRVHHRFVRAANGATRFGLTRGDIDDIELPLPPIKEQQKIMAALRQCDHEKELTEQRIKHLQSQKRGLMQKLLTGAWLVQVDKEAA